MALVLAMDVSSSVDEAEDRLQRLGLANALIDPAVQSAFLINSAPVAVQVFEWSGRYNQHILVDWTMIQGADDLLELSLAIAQSKRLHNDFPTAMGFSLGFAATQFARGPDCAARTIDVASDGINNDGFSPTEAYAAFPFEDVTVNGLIVNTADVGSISDLASFFQSEVIRGTGAFVERADGFEDYERAMSRKLIRELTAMLIGTNLDSNDVYR